VFLWLFRPIGRITDYARAIERGERPAKPNIGIGREVNTTRHRFLENIRAEAARSERLINRLLELAAIESKARLETERFYSLRDHAAGRKGLGLGLTLVREAAGLHRGRITLTPAVGGGTVATLTRPLG
jgi:signal transduction histidine kinase